MRQSKDAFPRAEPQFSPWSDNSINVLEANAQEWDIAVSHQSMGEHRREAELIVTSVGAFNVLHADYKAKHLIANTEITRISVRIAAKREAKKIFIAALCRFIKEYIVYNSLVTDPELISLGLKLHKKTHTPALVAKTYPIAKNVITAAPGVIPIHVDDSEGHKPGMTKGLVCRYTIMEQPPASWNDLPQKTSSHTSIVSLEFDINQRGKTIYFTFCRKITRGAYWELGGD